ncbi:sugar transferase [Thermoactinospora rubra]|uniref:sugar transferase n=1 Tax=Thermoactinospora rubra TaxID=1088767 RepID=UPI000A10E92A|nr:sugar transferase [Thermoactinospora rubra]
MATTASESELTGGTPIRNTGSPPGGRPPWGALAARPAQEAACLLGAAAVMGWSWPDVLLATALALLVNATLGLYDRAGTWSHAPRYLCSGLIVVAMVSAPVLPGLTAWLAAAAAYAALTTACHLARHLPPARRRARRAVVVGAGHGGRIVAELLAHPEGGIVPIGLIDDEPVREHVPWFGTRADCVELVRAVRPDIVIITGPPLARAALHEIAGLGCRVLLAPPPDSPLLDFISPGDHIRGFPLLPMVPPAQRRPGWAVKRALDVVIAALGLLAVSPLLALCALAVRLEGGPGVLFRQQRVGAGGRCFELLKFRTLAPADPLESATRWTIADDRRIGPVGRFLRKSSLDELPQLWNVLRGDMSLVGPRPERPFFVDRFSSSLAHYGSRHRVPVGITGWAQVHGLRGDTSIDARARYDNHYIDSWTLGLDVQIMLRTFVCVLRLGG